MTIKDFVIRIAKNCKEGEVFSFYFKLDSTTSISYITNKGACILHWFRSREGDKDFNDELIEIDDFNYTKEVTNERLQKEFVSVLESYRYDAINPI